MVVVLLSSHLLSFSYWEAWNVESSVESEGGRSGEGDWKRV